MEILSGKRSRLSKVLSHVRVHSQRHHRKGRCAAILAPSVDFSPRGTLVPFVHAGCGTGRPARTAPSIATHMP